MTTQTSIPLESRITSVFVHVSDLRRAAEWYCKLLGVPLDENRLGGGSGPVYWYDFPDTGLILDNNVSNRRNPDWSEADQPLCMFPCRDIDEAYAHVQNKAEPLSPPNRHEGMAYFNFRAPDGRVFMVCWAAKPSMIREEPQGESPVRRRIGGVFVNVREMREAAGWISDLLGLEVREKETARTIYEVPVTRGAALLLDDNRARNGETFEIPFMFDTDDIDAAFTFVMQHGMEVFHGIQRTNGGYPAFFTLRDPDGNLVMVCQGEE